MAPSAESSGLSASDMAHRGFLQATSICFLVYKNVLAGPAQMLIPEHTRDALFQIFCDLRTNSPKDRRWLDKHMRALKPRTLSGWLAMSSTVLVSTAGLGLATFASACAVVAVLYCLMAVFALGVVVAGAVLSTLAAAMLALACTAGFFATAAAWGYVILASPGALATGLRRLRGSPATGSGSTLRAEATPNGTGRPAGQQSLAFPASKPEPSSTSSTGPTSSDANFAANPSAANASYVEQLQRSPAESLRTHGPPPLGSQPNTLRSQQPGQGSGQRSQGYSFPSEI